jgi:hypothetical protein
LIKAVKLYSIRNVKKTIPSHMTIKNITKKPGARWWLTLPIVATQEAEIRRIKIQGQLLQKIVGETLSRKYPT